jgi:hypothetical protein
MVDVIITDACYYDDLLVLKSDPSIERRRRRALVFFMNEFALHKDGSDPTEEDIAEFIKANNIAIFPSSSRIFISHKELRMFDVTKLINSKSKHPPHPSNF